MARRRAIEADELFETANRLKAEGKEVTAVALLDALGGGSLRTIYKHLEVWQKSRPVEVKTEANEIPPQVQASFASAWRMAVQEAGLEVQAVKEKATEEVNAALRQFHGALEAIGKLETESEADAQELEALKVKLAEAEALAHSLEKEAIAHKSAAEHLQKNIEKQEVELEQLRAQANKAAELRGKVATLEEQNDKLMEQLTRPEKRSK
ncbi:MAG: hypothetical protein C0473_04245 [Cyanobacteria bacterium DS3.002]|nr:hypothetical protein [Cyanobacteria bacterium DS3.002]